MTMSGYDVMAVDRDKAAAFSVGRAVGVCETSEDRRTRLAYVEAAEAALRSHPNRIGIADVLLAAANGKSVDREKLWKLL